MCNATSHMVFFYKDLNTLKISKQPFNRFYPVVNFVKPYIFLRNITRRRQGFVFRGSIVIPRSIRVFLAKISSQSDLILRIIELPCLLLLYRRAPFWPDASSSCSHFVVKKAGSLDHPRSPSPPCHPTCASCRCPPRLRSGGGPRWMRLSG